MQLIDEHLELSDEGTVKCRKCGHIFCHHMENYKSHALAKEAELSDYGILCAGQPSKRYTDRDVVFRQFFCPGCATLLENEVILKELPPIWDKEIHPKVAK
ncbi:MAG: acetone carboxylase subunit gamma [Chloroflexi bacterium]|nr:acetone carboxylase subunit gamma [Chloroflexota bacterium]